jgi:hypothetical protein
MKGSKAVHFEMRILVYWRTEYLLLEFDALMF